MNKLSPPWEPVRNIEYRKKLRLWALEHERNRRWIIDQCRDDFFVWLMSFGWLYEPRPDETGQRQKVLPFVPWEHQVPVMQKIVDNLGYRDIGIEKARGEGATYTCMNIFLWRWLFYPMDSYALVSRSLEVADSPDNPDSLGAKLDWAIAKLPTWMVGKKGVDWERNISRHTWIKYFRKGEDDDNPDFSTIAAYPSTGDLAAGGRKTAIFMDELGRFPRGDDDKAMSASEPATDCRLLVSTYSGADGAYYKAMHSEDSHEMVKLYLKWEDNPARNEGLFQIDPGNDRLVEPGTRNPIHTDGYAELFFRDKFPKLMKGGYNVKSRTKLWSPWYVERCLRPGMTPQWIAQEYDRDPTGSSATFFPGPLVDSLKERVSKPLFEGEIEVTDELKVKRFLKRAGGQLRLWIPHHGGRIWSPPSSDYVIGVDVAAGTGASHSSNSVACILDTMTGRMIGEYATCITSPERFAEQVIALCNMFCNHQGKPAYLIWECNGPGTQFREHVLSTNFRNFYYRTNSKSTKRNPTKEPGWWSSRDPKREVLGGYRWALTEGYFWNPCLESVNELLRYHVLSGGRIEYMTDPSDDNLGEAGEAHGDRVIASALANLAMEERGGGRTNSVKEKAARKSALNPPDGSFLARRQAAARKRKVQFSGW